MRAPSRRPPCALLPITTAELAGRATSRIERRLPLPARRSAQTCAKAAQQAAAAEGAPRRGSPAGGLLAPERGSFPAPASPWCARPASRAPLAANAAGRTPPRRRRPRWRALPRARGQAPPPPRSRRTRKREAPRNTSVAARTPSPPPFVACCRALDSLRGGDTLVPVGRPSRTLNTALIKHARGTVPRRLTATDAIRDRDAEPDDPSTPAWRVSATAEAPANQRVRTRAAGSSRATGRGLCPDGSAGKKGTPSR